MSEIGEFVTTARAIRIVSFAIIFAVCLVRAEAISLQDGYEHCGVRNVQACENSNQLFWGPPGKHYRSTPKHDFVRALDGFLAGAPATKVAGHSFPASQNVAEALMGPGNKYLFSHGEVFFSGFTPHYGPNQAAVIFDSHGEILMVATLLGNPGDGRFKLTIYAHDAASRSDLISYLRNWGKRSVSGKSPYPGALPKEVFGETVLLSATARANVWRATPLR